MACGEHPQAADSVGINVYKMRWAGVLISGMLGGLGGICYILAGVSEWRFENGVAGFGFLALAVMIFGQWKPYAHRAGGAAVRPVPRALERLRRLRRSSSAAEHPRPGLQHDAVHHLSGRAGLHVQELQSAEGRGHPLRQGATIITAHGKGPAFPWPLFPEVLAQHRSLRLRRGAFSAVLHCP